MSADQHSVTAPTHTPAPRLTIAERARIVESAPVRYPSLAPRM